MCSADEPSVVIDNQVITLPSYQGFRFIADPKSPDFKKLTELYVPRDSIPLGFYYETHPVNINRVISIIQPKNSQSFISRSKWKALRDAIIHEAQQPVIKVSGQSKTEKIIRSALPQNKFFLIFTWETRFYTMNDKGNYDYQSSLLETKNYIYLNGKLIILQLSINALNPDIKLDNKQIYTWIALTFKATSQQILESNEPSKLQISLERKAQIENFKAHWKIWAFVFLCFIILGWKAYTTWLPQLIENHRSKTKKKRK